MNKIIPYTKEARRRSKELRKNTTPAETVLWERIRKKRLGITVFRQFPVLDYIVDFYIKEIGLAIEIDGSSHNNNFLEDAKRQERIEKLGIRFVRFTNEEILNNIEKVLIDLKNNINE